jgi:hypothetical protein
MSQQNLEKLLLLLFEKEEGITEKAKIWEFICSYDLNSFDLQLFELREKQPSNFIAFTRKAVANIYSIYSNLDRSPEDCAHAMNCIRLLTRIIPVAFDGHDEFCKSALWQTIREESGEKGEVRKGELLNKPCIFLLLDLLVKMLFQPGFGIISVDEKTEQVDGID